MTGNGTYTRDYALSIGGWNTSFSEGGHPTDAEDMYRHCYFLVLGDGKTYIRNGVFTNTTLFGNTQVTQGTLTTGSIRPSNIRGKNNSLDLYASTLTDVLSSSDFNSVNIRGNIVHLSMNNLYVNDEGAYNESFRGTTTTTSTPTNTSSSLVVKDGNGNNIELCFVHGIFIGWRN